MAQLRNGVLKTGSDQFRQWRVVAADFVTIDSGTGIVHQRRRSAKSTFELLRRRTGSGSSRSKSPQLICAVAPDGKFTAEAPDYPRPLGQGLRPRHHPRSAATRAALSSRAILARISVLLAGGRRPADPISAQELVHPHDAVQGRDAREQRQINWLPEHIRDGRFGNFLESNVDWALSRERYWGTPLPIWVCEQTGYKEAVGSYDELLEKPGVRGNRSLGSGEESESRPARHLQVHKPYIDAVTYDSAERAAGTRMRRVPDVIDCWYDSGAMPFAQWGYPHQGRRANSASSSRPTSSARRSIRPAAGFTASWRSARCCFARREEANAKEPVHDWPNPTALAASRSATASCWG